MCEIRFTSTGVIFGNPYLVCKNIRIYHGCEGWTEKSVPKLLSGITRLTEWCQTVIPRDGVFYLSLTPMIDSFSCILFISESGF